MRILKSRTAIKCGYYFQKQSTAENGSHPLLSSAYYPSLTFPARPCPVIPMTAYLQIGKYLGKIPQAHHTKRIRADWANSAT